MRWGGRSRLRRLRRGRLRRGRRRRGRGLRLRRIRRLALERRGGRGQPNGRGRLRRARSRGGRCTRGARGTPRRSPDAGLGAFDMDRTWLGRLRIRSVRAREGKQRDAHRRHDPHGDSRGGDRRSRMGPDAGPAHVPDRPARTIANHIASARRATRRRYATASSAGEVQRLRTCSRSSGGAGPAAAGGRTPPGAARPIRDWAQVWQSSMCQLTRSRVCSVSCPSQSASNSPSAGQASRLVSTICSAYRASSSRPRAPRGQGVRPAP